MSTSRLFRYGVAFSIIFVLGGVASAAGPAILSISVTPAISSATIVVNTDIPASVQVSISSSPDMSSPSETYNGPGFLQTYSTTNSVIVPNTYTLFRLLAGTRYYYVVYTYGQTQPGGNSGVQSFVTQPLSDAIAPSVAITTPYPNQTVDNGWDFLGTASDNFEIERVEVWVDNESRVLTPVDSPSPGQWYALFTWLGNPTPLTNGPHVFYAQAFDDNNNPSAISSIPFTLVSGPSFLSGPDAVPSVSSAVITATTDELTSMTVNSSSFSMSIPMTGIFSVSFSTAGPITTPLVMLTGLQSSTTYFYYAVLDSESGILSTSTLRSFVTLPGPPVITSPLSSAGTIAVPYTYQITATNGPRSFSASGLPIGLSLNSSGLISGTPTAIGTIYVTIGVSNIAGTDSKILVLTIGPNAPPTIAAAALANPNPAVYWTTALSVKGTDSDDPLSSLTYNWSLINSTLSPVSFTSNGTDAAQQSNASFTMPGSYTLQVVIQDPAGGMATSNVTVSVPALPAPVLNLPATLSVAGTVDCQYDSRFNISQYRWSFTYLGPNSNSGPSAPTTPSATLSSAGPRASLSGVGLALGYYQVTVYVVDAYGNQSSIATGFTTFLSADLAGVRIYPNPWRSDHPAKQVTFDRLPAGNVTVKIFTIAGSLVKSLAGSGSITWDLANEGGNKVASGIYPYLIKMDSGVQTTGELVVIR